LFLLLVLGAVLFLRRSGGLSFSKLFDGVAPAASPAAKPGEFQHLEVHH
jgi:hypothetical protein